jgi:O-antigen ligase
VAAGESKLQGSLPNGSVLGLWAAVTLPFCFAAALAMRGRIRLVAMAAVPLLAIGLLGSSVRTASVAAVAGVSLVLLLYQLSRAFPGPRLGTGAAALVGFAVAVVLIYPATAGNTPEKRARYEKVLSPSTDASFQERRFKWSSALHDSPRHPLGHGLGTAGIRAGNQRFIPASTGGDVDNSYVMVAFEQGVPAMIFLIFALVLLLVGLMRRAVWTRSPERAAVAIGAAGTLVALMLMFVTRLYIESLASLAAWLIVGLGVAQFSRVQRKPAGAAHGPPGNL